MRSAPIVVLLAVVLLGGCGSTSPPAPDEPAPDQAADTGVEDGAEGARDDAVVSVSMTQRGGLTGVVRTWRITERSPRHAHVFAAADRSVLEGSTTRAAGPAPCCDLFEYEVMIRYGDGSTKQLRTWDEADASPAVLDLVTAVLDSEPWYPDDGGDPPRADIERPVDGRQPGT